MNQTMNRLLTTISVAILVVTGTGAHGYITGRWSPRAQKSELAMPAIPADVGDWKYEALKSSVVDVNLRNVTRKYTHARTGRVVTVSLTLGPAGLVAQHTPEYCYTGSGYKEVGQTQAWAVPIGADAAANFRSAMFRKQRAGIENLRIMWAWSADGQWSAPAVPELTYLSGSLYKLYVVSWNTDVPPDQDVELREFVANLLQVLQASLFSPAATR